MSDDIKVGDLVMVIFPHNCNCKTPSRILGKIGTVTAIIKPVYGRLSCFYCNNIYEYFGNRADIDGVNRVEIYRLKKLDPPHEGETREAYVNLKQPRKVTA